MNRERAAELRDVFNAFADGKKIGHRNSNGELYHNTNPNWFDDAVYEVIPEPKEFWRVMTADNKLANTYNNEDSAMVHIGKYGGRAVLFREVTDE